MDFKVSVYILLIVSLSTGLVCEQDQPQPQPLTVSLPADTSGEANMSITIPIRANDLTDKGIISYQTIITFNENVLNATGASSEGTLTGIFGPPTVNTTNDGEIQIGSFGTAALEGEGIFVNLKFDIVGQPMDTTSLKFKTFIFNSGDPAANTENGMFTVSSSTRAWIQLRSSMELR